MQAGLKQISFPYLDQPPSPADTSTTFLDNLSLPIHRWFRFSAGFSANWVRQIIGAELGKGRKRVLDPFVGSGTVLLEAELLGAESIGIEAHPFLARIGGARLNWRESSDSFRQHASRILAKAKSMRGSTSAYPPLIKTCFPRETLLRLDALRRAWGQYADESPSSELCWLALVSILRSCSPVGTAQWQYVLPRKSKKRVLEPYAAFEGKVHLMACDMSFLQETPLRARAKLVWEDARHCSSVPPSWADLIVTSPPYPNNYDYADALRLEMSFFGEVSKWSDLQSAVRKYLLRSCTQHVAESVQNTFEIIQDPLLGPIRKQLEDRCRRLAAERQSHRGHKAYHTMIATYFYDMGAVWQALRRVSARGCLVCFVVGDSAPYGVHVPVESWLGELALGAGFRTWTFEKTRDRNVKWRNRKHRTPLHEGRLWVHG